RDVTSKDSNYRAIATLTRLSVATGDEQGEFHPGGSVSRYELSQALDRLIAEMKPAGIESVLAAHLDMPKDMSADEPAYGAVGRMIRLIVVVPCTDGYFRGKRPTTDAEVADAIARIKELTGPAKARTASAEKRVN